MLSGCMQRLHSYHVSPATELASRLNSTRQIKAHPRQARTTLDHQVLEEAFKPQRNLGAGHTYSVAALETRFDRCRARLLDLKGSRRYRHCPARPRSRRLARHGQSQSQCSSFRTSQAAPLSAAREKCLSTRESLFPYRLK